MFNPSLIWNINVQYENVWYTLQKLTKPIYSFQQCENLDTSFYPSCFILILIKLPFVIKVLRKYNWKNLYYEIYSLLLEIFSVLIKHRLNLKLMSYSLSLSNICIKCLPIVTKFDLNQCISFLKHLAKPLLVEILLSH